MAYYEVTHGFSDREKKLLEKAGYTPESAREYVVKKLKDANVSKENLKAYEGPIDELGFEGVDSILEMTLWHKDEPESFMKILGRDLSRDSDYMALLTSFGD